jgi:DNA-binding transcriptional MerR regulator
MEINNMYIKYFDNYLLKLSKTEVYDIVIQMDKALNYKCLSIKEIKKFVNDITYRKINDWDNKGLIENSRLNNSRGWRKFSTLDIFKFRIISDLRKIGLSIDKIAGVINRMNNYVIKGNKFPLLEFAFTVTACGLKNYLMVDEQSNIVILDEINTTYVYFNILSLLPIIILPFYIYVEDFYRIYIKNDISKNWDSSIKDLFKSALSDEEKKVIEIIRNNEYREITILKKEGNKLVIKPKSIKQGNFTQEELFKVVTGKDYQKVTVSTHEGKIVTLEQEESIKV